MQKYSNVDEYIAQAPAHVRDLLRLMRKTIKKVAPGAKEKIAYGIPTFTFHGNLVHFAGFEHHIGFYPGSAPVKQFAHELENYATSKGTIRFPLDKPLPLPLIERITQAAIERNLSRLQK